MRGCQFILISVLIWSTSSWSVDVISKAGVKTDVVTKPGEISSEIWMIRRNESLQKTEVYMRGYDQGALYIPSGVEHNDFLKKIEGGPKSNKIYTLEFDPKTRVIKSVKESNSEIMPKH